MHNAINWFEIPAADFNRARTFYSTIFDATMETMDMMGVQMAFFSSDQGGVGGGICCGEGYQPSTVGTLPYLNGGPDLSVVLGRVESAGGKVLMPKTQISEEIGYMAMFLDSEGNRIALHSMG